MTILFETERFESLEDCFDINKEYRDSIRFAAKQLITYSTSVVVLAY